MLASRAPSSPAGKPGSGGRSDQRKTALTCQAGPRGRVCLGRLDQPVCRLDAQTHSRTIGTDRDDSHQDRARSGAQRDRSTSPAAFAAPSPRSATGCQVRRSRRARLRPQSATGGPRRSAQRRSARSRALAVRVVVVPPLVGRRLRVARWRVFQLLLASERGDVEVAPGAAQVLVAAVVDEVGPEIRSPSWMKALVPCQRLTFDRPVPMFGTVWPISGTGRPRSGVGVVGSAVV
jgi:hypothetical protein